MIGARVLFAACVCLLAVVSATPIVHDPSYAYQNVVPALLGAGLAFDNTGGLYVYDTQRFGQGCLFYFPAADSTPFGGSIPFQYQGTCEQSGGHTVGKGFAGIAVTRNNRIYLTSGFEINSQGQTLRQAWNGCGAQHGIAINSVTQDVIISNYASGAIYRIPNPDLSTGTFATDCNHPVANTRTLHNTGFDGVAVDGNGNIYGAGYNTVDLVVLDPNGNLIGTSAAAGGSEGNGPDGISICVGNGVNFAITSDSGSQTIHRFNLSGPGSATLAQSTIVSNTGGYNDWTAVDTKGCIWMSTVNNVGGVWRLSNSDGSCMTCESVQHSDTCPSCTDVVTASYVADQTQSASATATGKCVTLQLS